MPNVTTETWISARLSSSPPKLSSILCTASLSASIFPFVLMPLTSASSSTGSGLALDAVNSFSLLGAALSPVFFGAAFDGARRSATCLISA
ncbi:MAG: hypothetical protein IPJ65_38050 [Archangiaceae bacterium]|nr:hypothetical protein [Archangiaceae bacterium]